MTANSDALDALHKAVVALMKAYDDAKPPQDQQILNALHIINREYRVLLGVDPNSPYAALTTQFKNSKGLIQGIINDRNAITKKIKLATQIVQALTPLLAFI